jgi:hypothetical protein
MSSHDEGDITIKIKVPAAEVAGWGCTVGTNPTPSKTPSADASAAILIDYLKRAEPFFFVRYGDGALECIYDGDGRTCDGEIYTPELGRALLDTWARLASAETKVFAGDWQSASFGNGSGNNREAERWEALAIGARVEWIHFETLLLMRESASLVELYRTIRHDRRRKIYIGPEKNAGAARFLQARHMVTPMIPNLYDKLEPLGRALDAFEPFEVVLYGAGMAGNVLAVDSWEKHRDRTYISLGSALDPLFGHKSRSQQLPSVLIRRMFRGML